MLLKEERALEAYAAMMNSLDASILEPLLAENFCYASQWVLEEIDSKTEYLNYIVPKLEAIRESGSSVWAVCEEVALGNVDLDSLRCSCPVWAVGNRRGSNGVEHPY